VDDRVATVVIYHSDTMMFYGAAGMRRITCELQTSPSQSYYADWCDEVTYKGR